MELTSEELVIQLKHSICTRRLINWIALTPNNHRFFNLCLTKINQRIEKLLDIICERYMKDACISSLIIKQLYSKEINGDKYAALASKIDSSLLYRAFYNKFYT